MQEPPTTTSFRPSTRSSPEARRSANHSLARMRFANGPSGPSATRSEHPPHRWRAAEHYIYSPFLSSIGPSLVLGPSCAEVLYFPADRVDQVEFYLVQMLSLLGPNPTLTSGRGPSGPSWTKLDHGLSTSAQTTLDQVDQVGPWSFELVSFFGRLRTKWTKLDQVTFRLQNLLGLTLFIFSRVRFVVSFPPPTTTPWGSWLRPCRPRERCGTVPW